MWAGHDFFRSRFFLPNSSRQSIYIAVLRTWFFKVLKLIKFKESFLVSYCMAYCNKFCLRCVITNTGRSSWESSISSGGKHLGFHFSLILKLSSSSKLQNSQRRQFIDCLGEKFDPRVRRIHFVDNTLHMGPNIKVDGQSGMLLKNSASQTDGVNHFYL